MAELHRVEINEKAPSEIERRERRTIARAKRPPGMAPRKVQESRGYVESVLRVGKETWTKS